MHKIQSIIRAAINLNEFVRNSICFFILSVLDTMLIVTYAYNTRNLVRPSGTTEALNFMFYHAKEYGMALPAGIVAYFITIVLIISVFSMICKLISNFINGEIDDSIILDIFKIVIGIALFVATIFYLTGLASLALAAVMVVFFLYFLFSES